MESEHIHHRFYKESEKKLDPLDGLVQELQKRNLSSTNNASNAHDEQQLKEQHQELDLFFTLIMQQVHVAAEQEERLLAGRLVTLEKVEKQFGSLLLTQIQATEARIRLLENKQKRLQCAIDQNRSIFGFIFVGLKSRLQLRSVRAQLRTLYSQHTELTETNKTFQYARRALLQDRKEKAVGLLERMRKERIHQVGLLLLEAMQKWLTEAQRQGKFLGFCVETAGDYPKPQEGFFGRFSSPLISQEHEWIEQICQLHGNANPVAVMHAEGGIRRHLDQFMNTKRNDPTYNLPNYLLLLMRLLNIREGQDESSNAHALPLYRLWQQGLKDKKPPSQEQCQEAWALSGSNIEVRLNAILYLIQEIEELHQTIAKRDNVAVDMPLLRHTLAKLFRPFVWKSDTLPQLLPKEDKPPLLHRKQWQEEISNHCDDAFCWWIGEQKDHPEA